MKSIRQAPFKDTIQDKGKTAYYNGIETIRKKTRLALQRGGGVMIWDLAQDSNGDTSLLTAIHKEMAVRK